MVKFKALKARSSKKVCEERLACKGKKPYAVYFCIECNSNQCEECGALLHEDFRLNLHNRTLIVGPPWEELCEGTCEDQNFADLTCTSCNRNFCYLCDHLYHSQGKQNHPRQKFVSQNEEFISCEDIPEEFIPEFANTDYRNGDVSESDGEMMSLNNEISDLPDLFPEHEIRSKYTIPKRIFSLTKSFLLINDKEQLQVKDSEEFLENLSCGDKALKVVSIFGNTGDGKSYTLNHVFFDGHEAFKTSASQDSCTVGVWASYCPSLGVIAVDTEGFLGQASNPNKRARMLLKILAISDIVIYRTRAERLHNDMFSFLGDASAAYTKHFSQELEEASIRCNVDGPLSVLGPAVIVFHETQFTDVLTKDEYDMEPEVYLRSRFQDLGLKVDAFCSLEYLGTCSNSGPTDFKHLRNKIEKHIQNSSVRVARSPAIVFKVLKVLNDKFSGNIDKVLPNTFPDQYFTCSVYCKSCKARCSNSMNHEKDSIPHISSNNCIYQHQFENKILLCKSCFERGFKIEVSPKSMESNDSSLIGFAKYAWSGYILECAKCGVIYRSRQYWYGNQHPWETCVRTEICHVWPQENGCLSEQKNTAQYVIDNLTTVSEVVSSIGAKPTKVIKGWVADQIAPSYWVKNSEIIKCGLCPLEFTPLDTKHHCRMCGGGFCENCAAEKKVVPTWGSSPVRVCKKCFEEGSPTAQTMHNPPEVTVRKIGEAVHSTLGIVANVAVNFPLGIIKDTARPTYWVADHLLKECFVCQNEFGPKLSIHHCRACGEGVCDGCSKSRKPVPSRGWTYDVRVCNACKDSKDTV